MKKTRIILILVAVVTLAAFIPMQYANATGTMTPEMEVKVGEAVKEKLFRIYGQSHDPRDNRLVNTIGPDLVKISDPESPYTYTFYVLDSDKINACAAPGGFIFVFEGLLEEIERDEEMIAGILAHEIAHVGRKHYRESILEQVFRNAGKAIPEEWKDEDFKKAEMVAYALADRGHSRENEHDADTQAVLYTYLQGRDPQKGIVEVLRLFERMHPERIESIDVPVNPTPEDVAKLTAKLLELLGRPIDVILKEMQIFLVKELCSTHPAPVARIIVASYYHEGLKYLDKMGKLEDLKKVLIETHL